MKLSRYAKILPSRQGESSLILFSTVNTSAVLVPAELVADIENGRLSQEEQESLCSLGLLTPDREREKKDMLGYIPGLNAVNTSLRIIVVLNLDCNLACTYCFEGQRKGKWYLSDETARDFISFVKSRDLTGKKEIKITFYGGEPLLSIGRITGISEQLGAFAAEKGLRYEFGLVTNGTLLTADVVRKLKPLGLTSAKVTLDGPADIHNRYRPFRSGAGSFDVIVRNIADVCGLIRIQASGNYTRESWREFPRLLDDFMARGLTPERLPMVKFDPVMQENEEFGNPDFHDGCASVNEPWISEASLCLRRETLQRGYRTQKVMPSPCLVELNDSFVMNYDGSLYKCPGLIGRSRCCVGHVKTGILDYRASHGLDAWKNEQCLDCAYLPLCFGGCRYMQLVLSGDMGGINCQKEYFERTLAEFVSQDLEFDL